MSLDGRRGHVELAWDMHASRSEDHVGWLVAPGVAQGPATRVAIRDEPRPVFDANMISWDRYYLVDDAFALDRSGAAILEWLCVFVAQTPRARAGLENPERVSALLFELSRRGIRRGGTRSHEPLMGPHLDLYLAVERALTREYKLLGGRRLEMDEQPLLSQLVALVEPTLPPGLASEWRQQTAIEAEIRRFLERTAPWPFDVLVED